MHGSHDLQPTHTACSWKSTWQSWNQPMGKSTGHQLHRLNHRIVFFKCFTGNCSFVYHTQPSYLIRFLINAHVDVPYFPDAVHFILDCIPIKITDSSPILIYFRSIFYFHQNVFQKSKIAKSVARSNIAQNGSKCPLIVLSSHILVNFSPKVDQ